VQIDLFTLAAQIVNFLVLVGLLRYFLYDRVIQAMDAREERITGRLKDAEESRQKAEEEKSAFQRRQEEWEQQQERRVREARQQVEEKREAWLDEARDEVGRAKQQWMAAMRREREEFFQALRSRMGRQAIELCRSVLSDLADAELEAEIIDAFASRLDGLGDDERSRILDAGGWTITTSFPLKDAQRESLEDRLRSSFGELPSIEYHTLADLLGGIQLRFDGEVLAWHLGDYLDRLEEKVREELSTVLRNEEEEERESSANRGSRHDEGERNAESEDEGRQGSAEGSA
jgi:F-type H+-transporting ATPase subunit b